MKGTFIRAERMCPADKSAAERYSKFAPVGWRDAQANNRTLAVPTQELPMGPANRAVQPMSAIEGVNGPPGCERRCLEMTQAV
jgi:hypothetical protein